MVWGTVLLGVAIIGGSIGAGIAISRIGLNGSERDVVITGPSEVVAPDTIEFEVTEPLDSDTDPGMNVGVGTEYYEDPLDCSIVDAAGTDLSEPAGFDSTLAGDLDYRWEVKVVADLEPGEYSATCVLTHPDAFSGSLRFTVGRTDEFNVGAAFALLGIGGIASLLFIIGTVLLIVGLVQQSRAKRPSTPWPYGQPPGYGRPPGYGQPPGYGRPPGYGQPPGYGPPAGYGPPPGYGPTPSGWPPPQPSLPSAESPFTDAPSPNPPSRNRAPAVQPGRERPSPSERCAAERAVDGREP